MRREATNEAAHGRRREATPPDGVRADRHFPQLTDLPLRRRIFKVVYDALAAGDQTVDQIVNNVAAMEGNPRRAVGALEQISAIQELGIVEVDSKTSIARFSSPVGVVS